MISEYAKRNGHLNSSKQQGESNKVSNTPVDSAVIKDQTPIIEEEFEESKNPSKIQWRMHQRKKSSVFDNMFKITVIDPLEPKDKP